MIESSLPFVSVVMPVRNEREFIATVLAQVFSQDYPPDKLEVVIADGMSDDGTREILAELAAKDHRLRVIDNPKQIVSTGLNAAIAAARGEIISRLDGHAEIAPDFVRQNVQLFVEHPDAWVVSGPIHHEGASAFGRAAAIAMSHPCGVGMARYRFANYEGYVDGAQFPAFRRWVFDKIGFFNETFVRTEDDELNYRVIKAGGKIFISPRVRYKYYVRDSIAKLARQYFQYSFWRIPVMLKYRRPTTFRQIVPSLFFLTMLALIITGIVIDNIWVTATLPSVYLSCLAMIGVFQLPRAGFKVALLVPVALITMHVSYAWGMIYGWWAFFVRPQELNPDGRMTRLSR